MRKLIKVSFFICFIICNNSYASNITIKGDFESLGDVYITGKGNIYITQKYIEGVRSEDYLKIAMAFDVTETAVKNFFIILKKKHVAPEDLDATFRQIATRHKELQSRLKKFNLLVDPEIQKLRKKAEQTINSGNYDKADTYLDEIIKRQLTCAKRLSKESNNCLLSAAEAKVDKGDIELIRINYKEATILFKEAVDLVPDGYELKKSEYRKKWSNSTFSLALLYRSQRKYEELENLYKQVLEINEKELGKDHPEIATNISQLGGVYESQGKYAEAVSLYKREIEIKQKELGKDHPEIATNLSHLAGLLKSQGKYAEAEYLYKRSLAINEKVFGRGHSYVASTLHSLAVLYRIQGKYEQAEYFFQRSLAIKEKNFGKDNLGLATLLHNFAVFYFSQRKYEYAEPLYQRILGIREKTLGKNHPSLANTLNNLALLYRFQGKHEEAKTLYKRLYKLKYKEYFSLLNKFKNNYLLQTSETIVLVVGVLEGSQAQSIGIQKGDIIQSYLGNKLKLTKELIKIVKEYSNSTLKKINITIIRNGELSLELNVNPGRLGVKIETVDLYGLF